MAFSARMRTARRHFLCLEQTSVALGLAAIMFCPIGKAQMAEPPTAATARAHPTAAPLAQNLTVTIGGSSHQYSLRDLEGMPQASVHVQNGHTKQMETYSGVPVLTLLHAAGLPGAAPQSQVLLRSYLRAQGTDFYFVLYSGSELNPEWHTGMVLVALKRNGEPLGRDGSFQLISTEDRRPARWVHNLNQLVLVPLN